MNKVAFQVRKMWLMYFVHPHSFSCNSTSKWRKLSLQSVVCLPLEVWRDPFPWWEVWTDTQEVTCLHHHQEECPSLLSHLGPRVLTICPITCPPCPWGHLLLMAYDYLTDPRPSHIHWFLLLFAETQHFWNIFIHLFRLWVCRTARLVTAFCVKILIMKWCF